MSINNLKPKGEYAFVSLENICKPHRWQMLSMCSFSNKCISSNSLPPQSTNNLLCVSVIVLPIVQKYATCRTVCSGAEGLSWETQLCFAWDYPSKNYMERKRQLQLDLKLTPLSLLPLLHNLSVIFRQTRAF